MSKPSCDVCCEPFNRSTRCKVECPSCEAEICRKCTRRYLLNTTQEPHCMNCKIGWSKEVFTNAVLKIFINNEYSEHRKNVLFEKEKAKLPELMPLAEARRIRREKQAKIYKEAALVREKQKELRKKERELYEAARILVDKDFIDQKIIILTIH